MVNSRPESVLFTQKSSQKEKQNKTKHINFWFSEILCASVSKLMCERQEPQSRTSSSREAVWETGLCEGYGQCQKLEAFHIHLPIFS